MTFGLNFINHHSNRSNTDLNMLSSPSHESADYVITEEYLRERMQHPDKGKLLPQILLVIAASNTAVSFGTVFGWASPSVTDLLEVTLDVKPTKDNLSWLISFVPLGISIGVLLCSLIEKRSGPKKIMMINTPFFLLFWCCLSFVADFKLYCAVRFAMGFFSVIHYTAGEKLLLHSMHPLRLKYAYTIFKSSTLLGVLVTYTGGTFLSRMWLSSSCAIFILYSLIFVCLLPESPVYLAQFSEVKAEKSLQWYRGSNFVKPELRQIAKYVAAGRLTPVTEKYMFYHRVVYRALFIMCGITILQTLTGYFAFICYIEPIFYEGQATLNSYYAAVMYGSVMYITNLSMWLLHFKCNFGIRIPLIVSSSFMTLFLGALTAYFFLFEVEHYRALLVEYDWLVVLFLSCFAFSYEIGLSLYPDVMLHEYFPTQVYHSAKAIVKFLYWFLNFVLVKSVMIIKFYLGGYMYVFLIMTVIGFIGTIFIYFFVLECKGKSFIQIQMALGGNPIGSRVTNRNRLAAFEILT